MSAFVTAVVAAAGPPVTVYFGDDASTAVPAVADLTLAPGDIVRVEVLPHGNLPIVHGKLS